MENAARSPGRKISGIPDLSEIHSRYVFSPLWESGKLTDFNASAGITLGAPRN